MRVSELKIHFQFSWQENLKNIGRKIKNWQKHEQLNVQVNSVCERCKCYYKSSWVTKNVEHDVQCATKHNKINQSWAETCSNIKHFSFQALLQIEAWILM